MTCPITDEQLFSWVDRDARELEEHLVSCPECGARVDAIRDTIGDVTQAISTQAVVTLPRRIGHYEIVRLLGTGGQGWVFEAIQPAPRRNVALKVVKGGNLIDDRDVRRLQREVTALAVLKHPGIAAIHEAGWTEEGQPFFAMELVTGSDILRYSREHDLSIADRVALFIKVCEALDHAHKQGVIHRDLKPSNILVEAGGYPKILDFGLAHLSHADGQTTKTLVEPGRILGTLPYMSPEHARGEGEAISVVSDVYSLSVILYELLTRRPPYELNLRMPHQALKVICEHAALHPRKANPQLPADLGTIILKGLEKEAARRYQSAAELADDLRRFQRREPIFARQSGALYRLRKLISRNKLTAAMMGLLFCTATGFGAWITAIYAEARSTQRSVIEPTSRVEAGFVRAELAERIWNEGRYQDVERHCRKALEDMSAQIPESHKSILNTRILLGRALTRLGSAKDAEPILRKAMLMYADHYPGQSGSIAEAKNALGECLVRLGTFRQAELLLTETYPVIRAYRGPDHVRTREARQALADLYIAWGKPDLARQYQTAKPSTQPAATKRDARGKSN